MHVRSVLDWVYFFEEEVYLEDEIKLEDLICLEDLNKLIGIS